MSARIQKTDKQILTILKEVIVQHGNLTLRAYNKLKHPRKPDFKTLYNRFGSFDEAKAKALGGSVEALSIKDLTETNKRLHKELDKQRNRNHIFISNCMAEILKIDFKPVKIPKPEKESHAEEFHLMKSDDQVGEKVDSEFVQGVSSYNIDSFIERMNRLTEKVILFRDQDKASLGLNKLVIYMLGDHVDGETIYKGQPFFIDAIAADQLMICFQTYVKCLLVLCEHFPEIEVFCVWGNHGRPGRKGENHPRTNYDFLLFRMLQETFALRQKNIKFYVSKSPTMLVQNGKFNFALNHFDSVPAWNGIPYYGLDRMARRLSDLYNVRIHFKLGGHFHVPSNLGDEILINGTMVGGSVLSVNKMWVTSRPSQKIFYFNKNYGIHRETNLHLADPMTLTVDENGIYTAYE